MPTSSIPPRHLGAIALAAAGVSLAVALPPLGAASNVIAALTAITALIVLVVGVRVLPRGTRGPWWWLVGMATLMTLNLVIVGVQAAAIGAGNDGSGGHAAAAGVMVIVLYAAGFIGLGMMVRRPRPGEGPIVWLDTALIFLAGAALLALVAIGPVLDGSVPGGDAVFISLIYPVVDLALLALVVRIAVGGIGGNPSLILLVAAFAVVVVIDSLIITLGSGDVSAGAQVRLIHLWVLWCVLMAAAVVAPGAARVRDQRPPGDLSTPAAPWRLIVLGVAMLVAPVLLVVSLVQGDRASTWLLIAITVATIAVALLRVRALLRAADARAAAGVASGEARERERIERDLHDGLQQHLIAIQYRIGTLEAQLDIDPVAARLGLEGLRGQAETALDDLRSLARGIPPVELERAGVGAALAAATAGLPVQVAIHDGTTLRAEAAVESAVYFACLEGIQNQMKHGAPGAPLDVVLATDGDAFTFSIGGTGSYARTDLGDAAAAPPSVRARVERAAGEAVTVSDARGGVILLGAIPMSGVAQ